MLSELFITSQHVHYRCCFYFMVHNQEHVALEMLKAFVNVQQSSRNPSLLDFIVYSILINSTGVTIQNYLVS